ncbi:MAG: paraquat-inducible protein A [Pseudomonadota bacterium]
MSRARAKTTHTERQLLLVALLIATGLLLAGVFAPLLTIKKMVLWTNTLSVAGSLQALWQDGQFTLFVIIGLFSVALPIAKLGVLFRVVYRPPSKASATKKLVKLMHDLGRWAMLDVLVVAVLLVTLKLGALASVQIHMGLYLFAAAVVLIALITHWVAAHPPSPVRKSRRKARARAAPRAKKTASSRV